MDFYMTFWIAAIIILTIAEILSINLTTIWYVVSAIVALILSFFVDNFIIQFGVFAVLGTILLITTKPLLTRLLKVDEVKTNLDRVIGMEGIVTSEIAKNVVGEVKVDGKRWSAISKSKIDVGDEVIIKDIDGVKLIVEKEGK